MMFGFYILLLARSPKGTDSEETVWKDVDGS